MLPAQGLLGAWRALKKALRLSATVGNIGGLTMRSHVPVSVSLPPDLFAAAEKRAAQLGFRRATYIQQLILADLRRQKDEGSKGPTVYLPPLSSSGKAPGAGARKGQAKSASASRKAPTKAARKGAAKKRR
jgi:hypothetical protein